MSTTKVSKKPTVRSICAWEPSERLTFQLNRSNITSIRRVAGDSAYTISRKAIKALAKQLDAGVDSPTCEIAFLSGPGETDSLTYTAERHPRGAVQLGCQVFSARAVKAIREWAGVPKKTAKGKK